MEKSRNMGISEVLYTSLMCLIKAGGTRMQRHTQEKISREWWELSPTKD